MSKRGPLNRHSLIALLEDSIEHLDDVICRGPNLNKVCKVQELLRDAMDWLDPDMVDRLADPRR